MTKITIHRVTSVTATRVERRDHPDCDDHDYYRLVIVNRSVSEPERDEETEITLYAAAGADIGFGPLVDDEAAQ